MLVNECAQLSIIAVDLIKFETKI